jgi:exosortase
MLPLQTVEPDANVRVDTPKGWRAALSSRAGLALAVAVAGWPVLRWYALRATDGSDDPLGVIALAAALWFVPRAGWGGAVAAPRVAAACAGLVAYIGCYGVVPPLIRAFLWTGVLALVVAPRRGWFAWWSLLALSLPVIATAQFYLGYPLRRVTTLCASWLLQLCGAGEVRAEATVLHWAGERVLIDAPCSGLQMLWTLLCTAALLANQHRLTTRQTWSFFRIASAVAFVGNTLRASLLFLVETHRLPNPPWAHDGVGVTLFGVALGILVWRAGRVTAADPGIPGENRPNVPAINGGANSQV